MIAMCNKYLPYGAVGRGGEGIRRVFRWLRARGAGVAAGLLMVLGTAAAGCQGLTGGSTGPGDAQQAGPPASVTILVSAAASLQDVLQEAVAEFRRSRPDIQVEFNFGSSGALAQQIAAGAPADLFIAAGQGPMDALVEKGLVEADQVSVVASSRVVLIAPRGAEAVGEWSHLAEGRIRRIAIGDPAHVPAGQYARQVLEHLGLWEQVKAKLVLDQDVRQVLHHVEAGGADAGVVYRTDAATSDRVAVVAEAPPGSHAPVVYPLAVIEGSPHREQAQALVQFLTGPQGQAIFQRHGFLPPENG